MKKLLLAFTICIAMSFTAKAQTLRLNKQQTVDYINKLFKSAYIHPEAKVKEVTLDGKILVITPSPESVYRKDLHNFKTVEVRFRPNVHDYEVYADSKQIFGVYN